ncbi:MAG: asparagine synthase (glutamine-hydrolyzing) [Cyclobacteriaceae bacterium]
MCGIVGYVGSNFNEISVNEALKLIKYRGPDNTGTFHWDNVVLGHNRLSILDLDPRSNQPFKSSENDMVMVYNGEVYNFKSIRQELISLGHVFYTDSDTEVLLNAYKQWGTHSFKKFHGMFALCILDKKTKKIVLCRDRFGEKPLFYQCTSDGISFASELKALLKINSSKPILDNKSIIDFLHFGYIPAPKTIYKNVFKLKPGYFLEYSIETKKILSNQAYYSIDFSKKATGSFQEKIECFTALAKTVASEVSISDVPLGAFLSGGVDSSGSVAFLKQINENISTFTAGFESDKFDESSYATIVAKHLNVKNTNKKINYEDFIDAYDKMVFMYDEPHNDFSFIPTDLICREAAKHHTVMISGDGADEIFCGYPRYHKLKKFGSIKSFRSLSTIISKATSLLPKSSNIRRQGVLLERSGSDFFFYIMCMNFSPDMAPMVYGNDLLETASTYSSDSIIDNYLSEIDDETSLIQKQRYLDIKMTLGDDMLVKVDRASMANSIEVRPFYLHPLITDFSFSLTPNELVTSKTDKYFLKKSLEKLLPNSILYRKKMGFTFPLKELILSDLRPFFDECISHLPPSLIDPKGIQKILDLHKKGDRNFVPQLHSLMYLGLWLKKNNFS